MTLPQFKIRVFTLEGLGAFATAYYFNYIFFVLKEQYHFTAYDNLRFCALNGFVFAFSALYGGKYAQKHGYYQALTVGCGIMAASLGASALTNSSLGLIITMVVWTFGMCFTWPTLEAMACEKENAVWLPRMIAIYNIVWAGGAAVAYFSGGWIRQKLGDSSIFWVPILLHLAQIILVHKTRKQLPGAQHDLEARPSIPEEEVPHEATPELNRKFQRLALIANPFAYIAMCTIIPLIPDLAVRLQLSPAWTGVYCSIWLFARLAAFMVLGLWTGWHYRFNWMIISYLLLILTFCGLLLMSNLWWIALAQLVLGWSFGLIYYSSLYYAMDASDTKGEHGGIHEAAIGSGIFAGPAIGAASLYFSPATANAPVYAVATTLVIGLGVLIRASGLPRGGEKTVAKH